MGFRFSLEDVNTVANLTCGRIHSCYDSLISSPENFDGFIYFLRRFSKNFYSDYSQNINDDVYEIEKTIKRLLAEHSLNGFKSDFYKQYNKELLYELRNLSIIFECCKIKSLLLPSLHTKKLNYSDDYFMTSEATLRRLLRWFPDNSCLILQPQENPQRNTITIFDAFPNFDIALKQADLWPAVMFWDQKMDFVFIPIKNENELFEIYETLYLSRNSLEQIKKYSFTKKEKSYYYFHLSDLHFGAKNIEITQRRLKSLITTQLSKVDIEDNFDFIVTGDAVDSPTQSNINTYADFSDFLKSKSGKDPIFVLGNHDIHKKGLAFNHKNQQLSMSIGNFPQIKLNEELKLAFLLFNSNANGLLAEGEIGESQMSEMGNLIDNNPALSDYKLVAVLHHHISPISKPNFYNYKWYQNLFSSNFLDKTLLLKDAQVFIEWLKRRNVKLVLHGHKHVPLVLETEGINIISCGSSTGQITHKDCKKTYLSFNLLKFNKNTVVCTQFAEDLLGAGAKDINTVIIDL